jgi:hypothetical protein
MPDIRVKPARAGMRMRHIPSGTELPDEGGLWPADSFTFRRITDGDLVEDDGETVSAPAVTTADMPPAAEPAAAEEAPADTARTPSK